MAGRASNIAFWAALAAAGGARADAIVTYHIEPITHGGPAVETLRLHGREIRIDQRTPGGSAGKPEVHRLYSRLGSPVSLETYAEEGAPIRDIMIVDEPGSAIPPVGRRTFTGESQTRLGERCRVWRLAPRPGSTLTYERSGCATDDGIELWRRDGVDLRAATRIVRAPVAETEVRPPLHAIQLASWARSGSLAGDHHGDVEVVLRAGGGATPRVTVRRSGAWTSIDRDEPGGGRWLAVTDRRAGLALRYVRYGGGRRELSIDRRDPDLDEPYEGPIPDRPAEVVLGVSCRWFGPTIPISDGGQRDCRTEDGVPLKIESIFHGRVSTVVAETLTRQPQPLSAVLPGPEIASPAAWGF